MKAEHDPIIDGEELRHEVDPDGPVCDACGETEGHFNVAYVEDKSVNYRELLLICDSCAERNRRP